MTAPNASDTVPGFLLQAAGVLLGSTGLMATLVAIQFLQWWTVPPLETLALYLMFGSGIGTVVVAWFVADGRVPAVVLGCLVAPFLTLFSAGWVVWCLVHYSFTLFMFVTPVLAAFSTLLLPLTVGSARRCAAAREHFGNQQFSGV